MLIVPPFQIVSLFRMLKFNAGLLHLLGSNLHSTIDGVMHQMEVRGHGAVVLEEEGTEAHEIVEALYPECKRLDLQRAIERLDELKLSLPRLIAFQHSLASFYHQMEELDLAIGKDLGDKLFLCVSKQDSEFYDRGDLFGPQVRDHFPEASKEITFAGNCYATGNYTACVFHLMRAVEIGARVTVKALGVKKYLSKSVELCDWGQLIGALQKGVTDLSSKQNTSAQAKAKYEFYNHAMAQFRNFKDAWRNNISHKRTTYLQGTALDIINSTRYLMVHLAERLKE